MNLSRNAHTVLMRKPEGMRPLGRLRSRWGDNIKMDLREVDSDAGDWRDLAGDRIQWRVYFTAVMNLLGP